MAILVMSLIVFDLARISGNPLDVMLPIEALPEDYGRPEKNWGLDRPLHEQYIISLRKALHGDFGQSVKNQCQSAMGLVAEQLPPRRNWPASRSSSASIMRLVRSSMLEVLDSEFVKLARVRGIPEWKIVWKHCLRNAGIDEEEP